MTTAVERSEELARALGMPPQRGRRWWNVPLRFARTKPLGAFGAAVIVVLLLVGLFPQLIAPYAFDKLDLPNRLTGPSSSHIFGADNQGRDIFSRVVYGAQTSIIIGLGTVLIAGAIASTIGTTSGYFGGKYDLAIQRVVDIVQAFPGLIFFIFILSIIGVGRESIIIALGVYFSASASRVVRAQAISINQNDYIQAAKATGATDLRVLLRHVYPNVLPVVIISISIQIGFVILVESTLSFLGFGVPPPFPSWGRMLQDATGNMTRHPYLALFPGLAIAITVYSLNMFGDALRDVLDPRLRGAR